MTDHSIQGMLDRFAIRETIEAYSNCVNRRDWENLARVFTSDGAWIVRSPGMDLDIAGAANIANTIAEALKHAELFVQFPSAVSVVVTGDTATATSVINEVLSFGGTRKFLYGHYDDKLVKEDGRWKFRERRFRCFYQADEPLPGQVVPVAID